MNKRVFLMLAGLGLAGSASAALFDNSGGGPTVATVGTASDYISLADAASSFSAVAGGINREWTLQINNSTSETQNSFFGNAFGAGGKLIIKPAPATNPVIHFTNLVAGAGIFGHMVIGANSGAIPTTATMMVSNNNYEIDGSNTVGGTTRNLTFLVTGNGNQNNILSVFGDNEGVVVKNAIWQMNDNTGSVAGVRFVGGLTSTPGGNPVIPDNGLVTNCTFNSPSSANGFGIQTAVSGNGTVPAGAGAVNNLTITNNDFAVRQRGIFLNAIGTCTITGNRITIGNPAVSTSGFVYAGIFPLNNNSMTGWTHTYANNTIKVENLPSTSGQGLNALFIDALTTGSFNIRNNIIKASITQATTQSGTLMGISMASANSTFNIEHNSIDLKTTSSLGLANQQVGAIVGRVALTAGGFDLKNNLMLVDATGTTAAVVSLASGPLVAAGNNLATGGSTNFLGIVGSGAYPTLAAWQGAGYDSSASGGQSFSPLATVPPWNTTTLHFANKPFLMSPVASSTVLTDVDGDARPATNATPGADEPPALAHVSEWSLM